MAQTVTFISQFTELELVRQPSMDVPVASGAGWIRQSNGVKYKFLPSVDEDGQLVGRLDVRVGQDKLVDTMGWLIGSAEQGVERDAPTALRFHKEYGHDFKVMPVPMRAVRARIRAGIANLLEDDLVGLLAEERDVSNRPEVISEAEDALSLVREQIANYKAAQEQAEQEAAPKAKAKPKAPAAA